MVRVVLTYSCLTAQCYMGKGGHALKGMAPLVTGDFLRVGLATRYPDVPVARGTGVAVVADRIAPDQEVVNGIFVQ